MRNFDGISHPITNGAFFIGGKENWRVSEKGNWSIKVGIMERHQIRICLFYALYNCTKLAGYEKINPPPPPKKIIIIINN